MPRAALFEVTNPDVAADTGSNGVKLVVAAVGWAAIAALSAFRPICKLRRTRDAFAPWPMPVPGRTVDPSEAPGLWSFVLDPAAGQGARRPATSCWA